MNRNLFPDPFEQPYEYWLMVVNAINISKSEKIRVLNSVGLDYYEAPSEVTA